MDRTANSRNVPPLSETPPAQPAPPIESGGGLTVEGVCYILILMLVGYTVSIVPSLMQVWAYYQKHGHDFTPAYLLLVFPCFVLIRGLFLLSTQVLAPALKPYLKDEPLKSSNGATPAVTDAENLKKIGNYIYQSIYYIVSVSWLLSIAVRHGMMPTQLWGPANPDHFCGGWPQHIPAELQLFYMVTLGHHFERTYYEFRDNRQAATFFTMVYHHLLTIFLINVSFWLYLHKFGVFILITHDFCDIILNTGRLSKVTLPSSVTNLFNVALLASWGYLRLVVFSRVVLYPVAMCYADPDTVFRRFVYLCAFILPILTSLFCLNAFWLFQILRIAFHRIFKKDYAILYIERKKGTGE